MEETKTCSKCSIIKKLDKFYRHKDGKFGRHSACTDCLNEQKRKHYHKNKLKFSEYRQQHRVKYSEYNKQYRLKNSDKFKNYGIQYRKNNKDKISEYNKKYCHRQQNNEKLKQYRRQYQKQRRENDTLYRVTKNTRSRISNFFKGTRKSKKTMQMLGCSWEELHEYLSGKFLEGMTWENYGNKGWHIDHIIPLCSAKNIEEIEKLCHYTNLQPLWAKDNISKGGRIKSN